MSGLVLMENAGRGVADKLAELGLDHRVLVCCGTGNNGGDGFVLARHLDLRRVEVQVLISGRREKLTHDAGENLAILEKSGVAINWLSDDPGQQRLSEAIGKSDVIIDALLGTGSRGEPRPPLDSVIDRLNASGRPIIAIDLPSGLDCDTGQAARHTICAQHTCTFVAPKVGFSNLTAAQYTGQVHVHDIGTPRKLVEEIVAASNWS